MASIEQIAPAIPSSAEVPAAAAAATPAAEAVAVTPPAEAVTPPAEPAPPAPEAAAAAPVPEGATPAEPKTEAVSVPVEGTAPTPVETPPAAAETPPAEVKPAGTEAPAVVEAELKLAELAALLPVAAEQRDAAQAVQPASGATPAISESMPEDGLHTHAPDLVPRGFVPPAPMLTRGTPIVVVSLVCATLVAGIGIAARVTDGISSDGRMQATVIKAAPPVTAAATETNTVR